jgi:hypothetical protein
MTNFVGKTCLIFLAKKLFLIFSCLFNPDAKKFGQSSFPAKDKTVSSLTV